MQEHSALSRTFFHRTNQLAAKLGLNVEELPEITGINRRTLFECRKSDAGVSAKSWARLEAAEKAARMESAGKCGNADPLAKPKDSGVREIITSLNDDTPAYGVPGTRDEAVRLAFRQLRMGLDTLEKLMLEGYEPREIP